MPQHGPIPSFGALPVRYHTIGDFYDAIDAALASLSLTFTTTGQRVTTIGANDLFVIRNRDDARKAVKLIKEQGEGTDVSQGATEFGGALAHYYQFEQITRMMKYVRQSDGRYKLDPASPVPLPPPASVYAMAPVPAGGYPGVPEADQFDQLYTGVLNKLQDAWAKDSDTALQDAIDGMYAARRPCPPTDEKAEASPFPPRELRPGLPRSAHATRAAAAPAVFALPAAPASVPGYARVKQILDEAVQGQQIGKHGPFCAS